MVIRRLQGLENHASVQMLKQHLLARNEEILSLLFYALWVYHADMRLMYQALKSENASVAIEMVETSIRGQNLPYLLPLIDDLPLDEKIEKGRKLFNLVSRDEPERLLTFLSHSEDPVTRMLSLYVIVGPDAERGLHTGDRITAGRRRCVRASSCRICLRPRNEQGGQDA